MEFASYSVWRRNRKLLYDSNGAVPTDLWATEEYQHRRGIKQSLRFED
jgi:hypothetical protein